MERIERALLKNRGIVVFFMVIVAALGLFCYYIIPKQENPTTTIAAAVITTVYPGAGPEEVESYMRLMLAGESTENERMKMLDAKRSKALDEIHFRERQLERMDYLRHEMKKGKK